MTGWCRPRLLQCSPFSCRPLCISLLLVAPLTVTPYVVAAPCWIPLPLSAEEEPSGAQPGSSGASPSYCVELLQELAEGAWAW